MSVIAVTLSGRTPKIHNSVRNILRISVGDVNIWISGKRMLMNTGSLVDKKMEDFRTTLLDLHKSFLDVGTITTEITALQILDDMGIISADVKIISANVSKISANVSKISANVGKISVQLDGVTTKLKWMSSQVADAGMCS